MKHVTRFTGILHNHRSCVARDLLLRALLCRISRHNLLARKSASAAVRLQCGVRGCSARRDFQRAAVRCV